MMQTKFVSQRTELMSWSRLSTVTNFDAGSTVPVGMAGNDLALEEVNRFSPISLLVESLVEQLCKLLANTPRQQKRLYNVICRKLHEMNLIDQSYDVEEFEFMRTHYQRALFHLLTVAKSVTSINPNDSSSLVQIPRYSFSASESLLTSDWSRYNTEYEELEYIARGGFGQVYKARNKLDGVEYAIKKICLQYRNISGFLRNLREVKMLAKLHHPNIVMYKAAWLEPISPSKTNKTVDDDASGSENNSSHHYKHSSHRKSHHSFEDDSGSIIFAKSESECSGISVNTSIRVNKKSRNKVTRSSESSENENISVKERTSPCSKEKYAEDSREDSDISGIRLKVKKQIKHSKASSIKTSEDSVSTSDSDMSVDKVVVKYQSEKIINFWKLTDLKIHHEWAMLYVQMQLCERTLRQWLDVRNTMEPVVVDVKQSITIFQQIVSGVCYIHSKNIVHHDIKPSNIFVNHDLSQVQVGDFGLACCLQHSPDDVALMTQSSSEHPLKHNGEIGTKLYAAPEQLRGKCDSKSDLYSLGIVLFELLQPFKTDMERSKLIAQLKAGNIPPELAVKSPKSAQLIKQLLSSTPASRPSADELQSLLVPLSRESCEDTESIDNKNEIIKQLLAVISQRDQEIEELRQQLQELQVGKS